jgi:hypothetical protein
MASRGMFILAALVSGAAVAQVSSDHTQLLPLTESGAVPSTTGRLQSSARNGGEGAGAITLSQMLELTPMARASVRFSFDFNGSRGITPAARLKFQFLKQETAGLDASVGVKYKVVGLDPEGGEVEGILSASRTFGRGYVAANVVGGSGVTTDEKDVEGKLGGGYLVTDQLAVGADARVVREIAGEEELAAEGLTGGSPFELVAGPTAAFIYKQFQASAIAGVKVPQGKGAASPYLGLGLGLSF